MTFHHRPIFPRGFRCASRSCGLKPAGKDLALFVSDVDAAAAAVFTRSHFPGAPITLGRETIRAGRLRVMAGELQDDPLVGAEGIMTTDSYPKALSTNVGGATITWVAKGSGMVEPNMATMLVYVFTDAAFDPPSLDGMLREAVDVSFNMLSVDGDTSTSDTCAILANGLAGSVSGAPFREALTAGCVRMTEILA